jgi:hypothetical protein
MTILELFIENEALRERARQNRKSIAAEVLTLLEENVPTAKELARRKQLLQREDRRKLGCLDANVAAKWFLPGAQQTLTEEAFQTACKDIPRARPGFWSRICSGQSSATFLGKVVRLGRMSRQSAETAVVALEQRRIPNGA